MTTNKTIAATLLCILLATSLHAQTPTPDKISAAIECESITLLLTDMQTVSTALGIPFSIERTADQLAGMVASPEFAGINTNKPIQALFVVSDSKTETPPDETKTNQPFVLILPMSDNGDLYLKSVGKTYSKCEKQEALNHFSLPPDENTGAQPDLYIAIADGKAVVAPTPANVRLVLESLKSMDVWKTRLSAITGTLKIALDIQPLVAPLESSLKQIETMMKQAPTPAAPGMPVTNPAQIISAEGDILLALMRQMKTYAIGIGIQGNALEISSAFAPIPESELGGMIKNLTPVSDRYLASMPANSFVTMTGSGLQILDIFIEPYGVMLDKIFSAIGPDGAKTGTQMKDLMMSMKGLFSGEYAMGVIPGATPKDMAVIKMTGVKDPVKARKATLDAINIMSSICSNMMPGLSMRVEKSRMSDGVEIIPYTVSYAPESNAMPQTSMMLLGLMQNSKSEMAIAGKDMIYTMGGPAITEAAIARLKTGGSRIDTSKVFTTLFPKAEQKVVDVYSIELVKLVKAYIASMPNGDQMLPMIPDTNSGLAGYSVVKNNDIIGVARLGLDEMAGIKTALPVIGLMMLPAMMGAGGANAPAAGGRTSPESRCVKNLRMLDAAKEQCALERGMKDGDTVNSSGITKYLLKGKMPVCPAGGTYTVNPIGKDPACSTPGHELK